jgi:hypothetical protein
LSRRIGQFRHPTKKPISELFVTETQHGKNQVLLGTKVLVHGRFRNAGLGDKPVHACRLKAISIKHPQRFLNQFIPFGWSHSTPQSVPNCTQYRRILQKGNSFFYFRYSYLYGICPAAK